MCGLVQVDDQTRLDEYALAAQIPWRDSQLAETSSCQGLARGQSSDAPPATSTATPDAQIFCGLSLMQTNALRKTFPQNARTNEGSPERDLRFQVLKRDSTEPIKPVLLSQPFQLALRPSSRSLAPPTGMTHPVSESSTLKRAPDEDGEGHVSKRVDMDWRRP